ncbi:hypothetical protein FTV92_18285 [Escherichia coli]|nr:hypothetical protein FTV92_18285 [Escherichia coli]
MVTTRIAVGLTAGTFLIFSQSLMAEISVFNPALLEIDHQSGVDIRQFNRANLTYRKLKNQTIPLSTPYAT